MQFINVYAPKYETAGKFWPIVHNSMIFSLVLMQAIAVGIFALKKLSLASTLVFPLPVITLLFNAYCRKRFLPNFIAYPAEVYIFTCQKYSKVNVLWDCSIQCHYYRSPTPTHAHRSHLAVAVKSSILM